MAHRLRWRGHGPARELREPDARSQVHLLGRHELLPRLRHLGLGQPQRQRCRGPRCDLTLDHAQDLGLEFHYALGEPHSLPLHEGTVKRRVDIRMHEPAHLVDLGLGLCAEALGGLDPAATLAADLDLLHERHLHVDAGAHVAEARPHVDRELRVRGHARCGRRVRRVRASLSAAGRTQDRRVGVGVLQQLLERDGPGDGRAGSLRRRGVRTTTDEREQQQDHPTTTLDSSSARRSESRGQHGSITSRSSAARARCPRAACRAR